MTRPSALGLAILGCAASCGGATSATGSSSNATPEPPATSAAAPAATAAGAPSGGTFSGTQPLKAFVHVQADVSTGPGRVDTPVIIDVELAASATALSGASVTAGTVGRAVLATMVQPGLYRVEEASYSGWYDIEIAAGDAVLEGVRVRGPSAHAVILPPHLTSIEPVVLRWAPNREGLVDDVEVKVFDWSAGRLLGDVHGTDTGELDLPPASLPAASTAGVQVRRAASLTLGAPNSVAIVDLTSSAEALVR